MFTVTKRLEIAGAHRLDLPYNSPCKRLHGHNWIITVEVSAEELNKEGMVIDFTDIKETVHRLDHKNLNDIFDFNPTAENIAKWVADEIQGEFDGEKDTQKVTKVTVQESEGNVACYIP